MNKYTAYTWLPVAGQSQGAGARRRRITGVKHIEALTWVDALKIAAAAYDAGQLGTGTLVMTGRTLKYDQMVENTPGETPAGISATLESAIGQINNGYLKRLDR